MKHDLPQVLAAKSQVVNAFHRREKTWKDIYDAVYSIATIFANKTKEKQIDISNQSVSNPIQNPNENPSEVACTLNPQLLSQTYGDCVLRRAIWGATYMSYLYDFLQKITWTHQPGEITQWVEILVSFKIVTGLVTPVQIPKINRVWQSPTVDHWLPLPPSLGVESNAFTAIVKSLEISVGKLLVPPTKVRDTTLPRIYCRTMQNAGVLGRACLPQQDKVIKILEDYMQSQPLKPREVPKLKYPLHIPTKFTGNIFPEDVLILPSARAADWKKFRKTVVGKELDAGAFTDVVQ